MYEDIVTRHKKKKTWEDFSLIFAGFIGVFVQICQTALYMTPHCDLLYYKAMKEQKFPMQHWY